MKHIHSIYDQPSSVLHEVALRLTLVEWFWHTEVLSFVLQWLVKGRCSALWDQIVGHHRIAMYVALWLSLHTTLHQRAKISSSGRRRACAKILNASHYQRQSWGDTVLSQQVQRRPPLSCSKMVLATSSTRFVPPGQALAVKIVLYFQ